MDKSTKNRALLDLFGSEQVDDSLGEICTTTRHTAVRYEKRKGLRVHREENLRRIFPETVEQGTAYHFLSSGDIDQLSYPTVLVEKLGAFPEFYVSTWTMTKMDADIIASWCQAGMVGAPTFACGEYFQKRETAAYASLVEMIQKTGGRLRTFPNHAKIVLMGCPERDQWMTMTGSSNLSMNPRTEATTLWNDREVYDFYRAWFESLFEVAG